jgi:acid stress-induced BolA-like protein IbaG/YrbA
MPTPEDVKRYIEDGMPGAKVSVVGDGHHFEAEIVSTAFTGKSMVEQHQMVYRALGDRMKQEIHALSLRTKSPE